MTNTKHPLDTRRTATVHEAAMILGLSVNGTRAAIARGEIPSIRIGRRVVCPIAGLERLLASSVSRTAEQ